MDGASSVVMSSCEIMVVISIRRWPCLLLIQLLASAICHLDSHFHRLCLRSNTSHSA